MVVLMRKIREKYVPISVMSIIATVLSTSIVPVFAVNTCPITHCHSEGDYLTSTRNGLQGDSAVSDPSFANSDPTKYFIAAPFWMVYDNGDWVEIGWLKGTSSGVCTSTSSPSFYRYQYISFSGNGACLGSASVGTTHTFKLEDTNKDKTWNFWKDGVNLWSAFAAYTYATPKTGIESMDSNIGTTGYLQGHFNNLKFYIGTTPYFWDNMWLVRSPDNSNNPYYPGSCADHIYHYQVKKGSVPSC